jgi:hypothetical protein
LSTGFEKGKIVSRQHSPGELPPPSASGTDGTDQADLQTESSISKRYVFFNLLPSWTVSFVSHVALLVLLAILVLRTPIEPEIAFEAAPESGEQLDSIPIDFGEMDLENNPLDSMEEMEVTEPTPLADLMPTEIESSESMSALIETDLMSNMSASDASTGGLSGSGETGARSGDARKANGKKYGATPESEEAVELALEWLAKHQLDDGSWNFDHTVGNGTRSRKNPGTLTAARAGATGLALMTFLGCGETHQNGKYQEVVRKGLEFLVEKRGRRVNNGFSFFTGDYADEMYSHGICSIVLCEAYGMTGDTWLKGYAQACINFIESSQHEQGGWRYKPKQAGDTSAVGWQLMALKSGVLGGLEVNKEVLVKASRFLDRVSINSGAHYGYAEKPNDVGGIHKAQTAIGLLCRMYLGWKKENPALGEGVTWIQKQGPSMGSRDAQDSVNMYYNYYATQLVKQYGGDEWKVWNNKLRDFLVQRQDTAGNERGSWYFAGGDLGSSRGGRLYCTCMAAMTLEVYYRYSPIYDDEAVNKPFELD